MKSISIEKIEKMLKHYRLLLERASFEPIDYVAGVKLSAQISLLEHLYVVALNSTDT